MTMHSGRQLILIAHNLRSTHNVGSLLRTADGLGVAKVILSGYTPYPIDTTVEAADVRLPHLAAKIDRQIHKTALGAERSVPWEHASDPMPTLLSLRGDGWHIAALEQAAGSTPLPEFTPPDRTALLVGREVEGIEPELLVQADTILELPMLGDKESFNVAQAAAMALYHCRYF